MEALRAGNNFRETEFKELCASVRHYSGIRFLVIPIFLAIQGGILISLREGVLTRINISRYSEAVIVVPILLGAIFVVLEASLNRLIDNLVNAIKAGWPNSFWAKIPRTRYLVTISVDSIYVVVTVATSVLLWFVLSARTSS
jgi:hypothetical protein